MLNLWDKPNGKNCQGASRGDFLKIGRLEGCWRGSRISGDKAPKRIVPWYRYGRKFWARGALLAFLVIGSGWLWKFTAAGQPEEITATLKRANLSITVTERGELESSKTIKVRCEVEGYQNKIISILPEGTIVKGPGWFWWEPGQVVVALDMGKLKTDCQSREVSYKAALGRAQAAKADLEVQTNQVEGEVADATLALELAEIDRDKYLQGEFKVEEDEKRGDIDLAKKNLKVALEKLENYRKFVKKGFGTPEALRLIEINVDHLKYLLKVKEDKLMVLEKFQHKRQETELTAKAAEAKRKLDRAKKAGAAAIARARSNLDAAEAVVGLEKQALDRLHEQLDKCVIRAPADGVVVYSKERGSDSSSRIQTGAMVHYQQTLFQLADLGRMQAARVAD